MFLLRRSRFMLIALVIAACSSAPGPSSSGPTSVSATGAATSAATLQPQLTAAAVATPSLPRFDPNEPLLLYTQVTGAGGGVFVMHPDGTGRTQLATDILPGVHKRGDWSPDGQHVVFIDEPTEKMWLANLDGSPTTPLPVCDGGGCDFPKWSPDGKSIVYSRVDDGGGKVPNLNEGPPALGIYLLDLASGSVTKVVRLERPMLADVPVWSPDGKEILFEVDRMDADAYETGCALAIVPVTGGEPRYITPFEAFASSHDWSRLTGEIAYSTELIDAKKTRTPGDANWQLWGVQPDGSGLRQITHVPDGQPMRGVRWQPDGSLGSYDITNGKVVFVSATTGALSPSLMVGPEGIPLPRPVSPS